MVFCNNYYKECYEVGPDCHNPYFNRWFSAIGEEEAIQIAEQMSQSLF